MADPRFSGREALQFGWATATRHFGFFIVVLLVLGVIHSIPTALKRAATDNPGLALLAAVAYAAAEVFSGVATIRVGLRFSDGVQPELDELFTGVPFFRYLGGIILQGVIVVVGLVLLIVPGLIWAVKYLFTGYLIVDKGLGAVEALHESGALTQGVKRDLFVFSLVLAGINILGALALIVGLLWTVPMSIVATAHVYRQLQRSQAAPVAAR